MIKIPDVCLHCNNKLENIVYKLNCTLCKDLYVGRTSAFTVELYNGMAREVLISFNEINVYIILSADNTCEIVRLSLIDNSVHYGPSIYEFAGGSCEDQSFGGLERRGRLELY